MTDNSVQQRLQEQEQKIIHLEKTILALGENDDRYRTLFENMTAGFVLFEVVEDEKGVPVDLVIVAGNQGFATTTGLSLRDVLGKRLTEVLPGIENDAADWIGAYGKIALTGESRQFAEPSELLGRYYDINAYQPGPNQCAVTFTDITDQKKVEIALRENEDRLRHALRAGRMGSFEWNVVTDDVIWSDGHYRLLGHEPGDIEATNANWVHQIAPEDFPDVNAAVERARIEQSESRSECRVIWPDKSIHWLESRGQFTYDNEGNALRMFGIIIDIDARKTAEKELANRASELESLHQIGVAIAVRKEYDALMQFIIGETSSLMGADGCSIMLLDAETDELVIRAALDDVVGMRVPPGKGISGRALRTRKPQIVNDVSADPDHYPEIARLSGLYPQSLLAQSLQVGDRAIGVLLVLDKREGKFSQLDGDLLAIIASHAATAIENAELQQEIQQHSDDLEERVEERTAELKKLIKLMAGREVRMSELKTVIKKLRAQLNDAGITPVADDPLLGDL